MTRGVIYGQQLHGACQTLARLPPCSTLTPKGMQFEHPVWATPSQQSESKLLVYFSSPSSCYGDKQTLPGTQVSTDLQSTVHTHFLPLELTQAQTHVRAHAYSFLVFSSAYVSPISPSQRLRVVNFVSFFLSFFLLRTHTHLPSLRP